MENALFFIPRSIRLSFRRGKKQASRLCKKTRTMKSGSKQDEKAHKLDKRAFSTVREKKRYLKRKKS
jgi:hypothetical protein